MVIPRTALGRVLAVLCGGILLIICPSCSPDRDRPGQSAPTSAAPVPTGLGRFYAQRPVWGKCPSRAATETGAPGVLVKKNAECTRVEVPLDYAEPAGQVVRLFVARLRAPDRARRLGSLMFNPGGPGGPGAGMVAAGLWSATPKVAARYDIVGFDPRGVGLSQPVSCGPHIEENIPPIRTRSEFDRYVRTVESDTDRCAVNSGELLGQIGTINVAKDLDVLRAVLGDEKLNYVGVSYGTYIGVQYLAQFAGNAGRIVLDSVIDPTATDYEIILQQATGFDDLYRSFLAACVGEGGCGVGRTAEQGYDATLRLVESVATRPLPTRTGRTLDDESAVAAIAAALYSREVWPLLELGLGQAMNDREGSTLLYLADLYRGLDPETGKPVNNMEVAAVAVSCLDRPRSGTVQEIWEVQLPRVRERSELFGTFTGIGLVTCAVWPERPARGGAPKPPPAAAIPPTLITSNTNDPATPYTFAVELSKDLPGSVLVSRVAQGHGAYAGNDACVDKVVDTYLIAGTLPEENVMCR